MFSILTVFGMLKNEYSLDFFLTFGIYTELAEVSRKKVN